MLKIKCSCGFEIKYNNAEFVIPSKDSVTNIALSAAYCLKCGNEIAILATSIRDNEINIKMKGN